MARCVKCLKRSLSGQQTMNVFDRGAKTMQRNRAALLDNPKQYDYIRNEVGYQVYDRICDIKRKFPVCVELGCHRGHVSKHISLETCERIYQCDMAENILRQSEVSQEVPTYRVLVDEEFLPFASNSLDLVVSALSLHWVNDLPSTFKQMKNALKDDGVFIGAMFGGETLHQLRSSLQLAEVEREGGFGVHMSPMTDARDLGDLLHRAGFTLLTIDTDEMTVNYPSMFELLHDLRGMGETNAAWNRKPTLHRQSLLAAAAIYKEMYGNEEGWIPATFHIIHMIGWKPHASQPRPVRRGSGQVSMKDLEKVEEIVKDFEAKKGER